MTQGILTAGQVAGAFIAIFTLLGMIIKFAILKPIKAYIDKATYQIQPFANGGKSLADVAKVVNEVKSELETLNDRVEAIEVNTCKKPRKTSQNP
jgi:F0F1-type ATP synthase membrane subunit b/b'